MTFPKFLAIATAFLFSTILLLAYFKSGKTQTAQNVKAPLNATLHSTPIPIELGEEVQPIRQALAANNGSPAPNPMKKEENTSQNEVKKSIPPPLTNDTLPDANRIEEFFNKREPKLPFIETIVYKSRVNWLKGRPAWLSDYASFYGTSRHFIARSLNGKREYFHQEVSDGDTFNVFRKEKNIQFYLLVDVSRCKMWFYALDTGSQQRTLLKTYRVGLGRVDGYRSSGLLTPLGKYSLGSKIAIYRPKTEGLYNGKKVEMVRIFGTRWIPFEKEIGECTAPAKGLGLHGLPLIPQTNGAFEEDESSLGKFESDGCIRLATADIEELFAIIVTKPTVIELVKNFSDAELPGIETKENP